MLAGQPFTAQTSALRHPVWLVASPQASLGLSHRAAVATPIRTAACPSPGRSTLLQPTPTKTTLAAVGAAMRCGVTQFMAVLCCAATGAADMTLDGCYSRAWGRAMLSYRCKTAWLCLTSCALRSGQELPHAFAKSARAACMQIVQKEAGSAAPRA